MEEVLRVKCITCGYISDQLIIGFMLCENLSIVPAICKSCKSIVESNVDEANSTRPQYNKSVDFLIIMDIAEDYKNKVYDFPKRKSHKLELEGLWD